jgi:aspartate carbamoyltransferase catalytic subunit
MADEGPQAKGLGGLTYLSAFFQESTRTRLGFMAAAARQGATVLDAGSVDRFRLEPVDDQQMVLAGVADIAAVRHWDATYARTLAFRGRCCVVNAGAGSASHPTQALIDAYTLTKAVRRDLTGLRVIFLGPLLRSAVSFEQLARMLGVEVSQVRIASDEPGQKRVKQRAEVRAADVIYVQSLSDTRYDRADLNTAPRGPALPEWVLDEILGSDGFIMHALPRGSELPDSLMGNERSLVAQQVEQGLPVRSAILRLLARPS